MAARSDTRHRIVFANQLRGVAALSVVVSHLVGVFWAMRDFAALATSTPVQTGPNPPVFDLVNHAWFQNGPFGVGLFFLISGLVIPISLERTTSLRFIAARMLRIYPTYVVALLLQVAILHATSAYWQKPFPYSDTAILANALLIHNAVGQPSIDLVNWTLCIELKFYLLMAVLARPILQGRLTVLFAVGIAILGGNLLLSDPSPGSARALASIVFATESPMIVFMLIGVIFNYRLRGLLTLPAFLASLAAMVALFIATWRASALQPEYPAVTVNYLYGIVVFATLFALRRHAREIGVLNALAAISYPFYLIHCIVGIVILKIGMMSLGLDYLPALGVTLAVTLLIAWGLHATVEAWSVRQGRRLAGQRPKSISNPPPSRLTRKYRGSSRTVG